MHRRTVHSSARRTMEIGRKRRPSRVDGFRRRSARRLATFLALVVALSSVAGSARAAGEDPGNDSPESASCGVYPIALRQSRVDAAGAGSVIDDIANSPRPGHEGWLTWTGDVSEPALKESLTPPGDDSRYVNPNEPADHVLSVGDWVLGRPGAVSSAGVRTALDKLIGTPIVVPVWDSSRGRGANGAYHVSGFARVEIVSYTLHHDNEITAKYLGASTCVTPTNPPLAQDARGSTDEDRTTTIVLTGSSTGSTNELTFALAKPGSGVASLIGQPTCTKPSDTSPDDATPLICSATASYAPTPDFFGPDAFTFTVFDGQSTSVPASVSIDVSEVNDPPAARADSLSAAGGRPIGVNAASLLANDSAGPSNEATQTLVVAAAHADAETHGTVTLARGTITYIPDVGFSGATSFTSTVCDNGTTDAQPDPKCADGKVSITVTPAPNQPPVAEAATVAAVEDSPVSFTLAGDDLESDPITYEITSPAHGTLSGTAPALIYTPAPDFFGLDAFEFTVFDGQAVSVPAPVSITVREVNDPPVAGADSVSAPGGRSFGMNATSLLANDTPGPANEANQALQVTAVAGGGDTHGTVSLIDGTITYTPDAAFNGAAVFTYTVCDDGTTNSESDSKCTNTGAVTLNITAPNEAPNANAQSLSVAEDKSLPVTLSGSDPEGDPITYSATSPAHGTLAGTAPALTYTPAPDYFGPDAFTFTTHDVLSSSRPATVTITVTEVNDPPELGADFVTLGGAGTLPPPAPSCGTPCGVIYGDPHLLTFDRTSYDAQAVGEVIAARSTTDDFELQARFAAVPRQRVVSIAVAVAMRVAGHRVELYRTSTGTNARIDGTPVTVKANPQPLPGGGTIGTYGVAGTVTVTWPDRSVAIVQAVGLYPEYYRFTVNLGLAPSRLGHMVGLLGNADGIGSNDLVTRGGQPVTFPNTPFAELYGTYINSWRIGDAESLFDYDAGQTTATFTDLTFPDAPATPQTLPADARASATNVCALFGLTTAGLSDACIVDVGLTGDGDFANNAAAAQGAGLGIPSNTGGTAIGTATTVSTSTIGENAVRTFAGTAGQKLTLTATANTYTAVDITVRSPSGQFVTSLFASTATAFRDVFTLAATGTYTITIDPRDQLTGTLTFLLASVPDNSGSTTIGTPTTVSTSTIGENAVRTFAGTAGQKLTLTALANTYTAVDITVRDPNGQFVTSLFASTATAFRDAFTLPAAGAYTITIDPRDQLTGALTFLLAAVPDNSGSTTIGTPTTVTTSTIGENAVRTFPGTAGQKLTLTIVANSYTAVDITVRDPNGQFVTSLFVSSATAFRDVFTLATTGTYTITVDPREQLTGTLTFLLANVPNNTGSAAIGTPTTVSTSTIGENAVRTFPGTAGQKLTLSVSGSTYTAVDITVRGPSGQFVTSLFASSATAFRDVFTLPVTGTYTITIDPREQLTGTLTFLLADVAAPAPGAALRIAARTAAVPNGFIATAGGDPELTIPVAQLLANDRPGPSNESAQTLIVTDLATGPATHGTATLANDLVTYMPDTGFTGLALITYTVCDDGTTAGQPDPRCSDGTLTVKVTANHPPTVDPQTLTTTEDTPVSLTLTGADPDGDPFVFVVGTAPSRGSLSGSAPQLTYKPDPDANGVDTFTITANDGHDQSAPVTVTINVTEVNDSPVPDSDKVMTRVGNQITVPASTILANDVAGPFDEDHEVLTITAVTPGADTHGTVSLGTGGATYDPDPGFTGTGVIGYTVCDNGTTNGRADPRCAESTLSIVLNRPPSASDQTAQTSRTAPIDFTLSATDPEDDALTYAITSSPQHGTLSGTAPTVTYTANTGFVGNDAFSFIASDAYGPSSPATVSIAVNDVPAPTLHSDSASVLVGASVLLDVLVNDIAGTGSMDAATVAIASAPSRGAAAFEAGRIRYTPSGTTSGSDTFSYTACDTGGGCGTAVVTITVTVNHPPAATADSYDIAAGTTLHPSAPGVLANDTDPDAGDKLQARLVRGVTNGTLLLNSTGAFTYTPNGPGIDTFVYHVLDPSGAVSNDATVTVVVTGPPGPPIVGNDLFQVQQGRELDVTAPGVLDNDTSPNPRLRLTVLIQRDTAKGMLLLHPDGSFVYTPAAGYTGLDQFSYVVRDSEGRVSQPANVGITVKSGGPPTAIVGATSPAAGSTITEPIHFTATLIPPTAESVTAWTVSYRRPGAATLVQLATGSSSAVAADFDPTTLRNGTYAIVIRAVTSGGGILVSETGVSVEGDYKPGRYATTYRDVAVNSANIPIDLFRTYDSTNKTEGDFGVGWSLDLAQFRIDSNGPIGGGGWSSFTCGAFPFLATCYKSSVPHFVTVTWPDGHLERFRFAPDQGSQLVPSITTAGFVAEPGTTSTLAAVDEGLLLTGSDFLAGDFFSADGIYDPSQFVLTDKSGTKYTLDRRAGVVRIVDRNGNTVTIGSAGLDSSSGLSMTFARDADNRITRIGAPGGDIDYTYSAAGDLIGVKYPNGATHAFTYDSHHDLLTTSGGGQVVRTLHYDSSGRVIAIADGNGNTAHISIDVTGHQQVVTDAIGQLTTVNTYDERGDLIQQDRVAGAKTITTKATYDSVGRMLSSTDGLGHTTSRTYDAAGNVLTSTDANGKTTTSTYNVFGEPLTIADPLGHVTTNKYDAKGNLIETDAPAGGKTTYTYDAAGRMVTTTDLVGRVTSRTYDSAGQVASVTDNGGNTLHSSVDGTSGRISSTTDEAGATTTFGYDADGNLTTITDGNGHTRTATYDAFDRVTSMTDASGATVRRTYDPAGKLISIVDRNGQTITYTYDGDSRLVAKTVPGAGTTTYAYDAFGRRTADANDTAHLTFTYDDADHILTATSTPTPPNVLPTTTFTYSYDAAGSVLSVQGPGGTTGYTYDAGSRLATLVDPAGGTSNFDYDPAGRQTSLTRPNGITDAITYDAAGELTTLHSTLGATVVSQADYTYNPVALRSSLTTTGGTANYAYDAASQLTAASQAPGSSLADESYSYDAVGNRTSSASSPLGSFTYDSVDRMLSDATHNYTYDEEGNLVSRTVKASGAKTTYAWTAEHQLVAITYPDNTTSTFSYDPLGRRVAVVDGSATTRYAYDGHSIAAEYDGTNTLAATYVHDPMSPTRTFEMTRGGQRYFYLTDAQGSTTALTTIAGATANTYTYNAFGVQAQTGSVANPFTYAGQLFDATAALLLFPLRAYDPSVGRFLSEDPLPAVNPYPYVSNNPTNSVDPTGAQETTEDTVIRNGVSEVEAEAQEAEKLAQCIAKWKNYYYPNGWYDVPQAELWVVGEILGLIFTWCDAPVPF